MIPKNVIVVVLAFAFACASCDQSPISLPSQSQAPPRPAAPPPKASFAAPLAKVSAKIDRMLDEWRSVPMGASASERSQHNQRVRSVINEEKSEIMGIVADLRGAGFSEADKLDQLTKEFASKLTLAITRSEADQATFSRGGVLTNERVQETFALYDRLEAIKKEVAELKP